MELVRTFVTCWCARLECGITATAASFFLRTDGIWDSQRWENHDSSWSLGRGPTGMAKPYSKDLRQRAVAAVESGPSRRKAAAPSDLEISGRLGFCCLREMHRNQAASP